MDTPAHSPAGSSRIACVTSVGEAVLDPAAALAEVQADAAGAAVLFTGVVRDHDGGRGVRHLEYSSHPTASDVIRTVAEEVLADHPVVQGLVAHHRVGPLEIGEVALVAAVSTAHRGASFAACEDLVERIKERIPIWKRQVFDDGEEEWVNSP